MGSQRLPSNPDLARAASSRWPRLFVLTAAFLLLLLPAGCRKRTASSFEYGEVTRGNIENVVSSTGELEPIGTVTVGTQVSGTVDRVLVDFNARVSRGQLLAVLDTSTLAASVRDAEAGRARAQAQYAQAANQLRRMRELADSAMASQYEFEAARTESVAAAATLSSAEAALDRARVNLEHAYIRSPISGRVVDRAIEPGVTVAASFSSPTLFTLAQNLSRVRILAQVDESDIGQIDSGVPAKFTVQAYPDREFDGVTTQVRMLPTVSSNVVNYTVVVEAANEDEVLLPGMTATVDFHIASRTDVLLVPSTALKVTATKEMLAEMRKSMPAGNGDSTRRRRGSAGRDSTARGPDAGAEMGRLWYLDAQGKLKMMPVRAGATDGQKTEVTPLRGELAEGTRVITKATGEAADFHGPPGGGFGMPGRRGR